MRQAITAACVALLVVAAAVPVVEVHAREWRVRLDGTGDFTTIGAAIEAAAEGDSILIGSGDYSAEDFLYFREPLWVSGENEGAGRPILPPTAVNVARTFELSNIRILSSPASAAATIWARNVAIRGSELSGGTYSGLQCWSDSVLISECEFTGNATHPSVEPEGGGLRLATFADTPSHHVIDGCTFIDNTAGGSGGAIYACPSNDGGSVIEIRNCFFLGNEAPEAASIDIGYCWDGVPRITNNTFIRNKSSMRRSTSMASTRTSRTTSLPSTSASGTGSGSSGSADATSSGATGVGDSTSRNGVATAAGAREWSRTRSSIPVSAIGARATTR